MTIKSILVPLTGADNKSDTAALERAFELAALFNAHVDALHISIDPRTAAAFVGEGMTSTMIESIIDMAEADGKSRQKAARETFETLRKKADLPLVTEIENQTGSTASTRFLEKLGNREDVLESFGRLFDLIIIGKAPQEEDAANTLMINTALRETGRPVLLLDPGYTGTIGTKVALAWNGSVESSRALTYSLPFLTAASKVTLISAIDDLDEEIHPDEAIHYLALHGITAATCEIKGSNGKTTAESLLTQAANCDADLLVMGAFTRSRLRRLFFGAVTEEVLANCTIPVLMAH
ncbi:universal stress protein [Sneathiella marina]|uniref:Universal stress protein n=1 Tax=Sneathiella marina TaxID=2950108 RepID=A0ABY4W7P0_9PROT|nr:universal stress protein [Sneathiella marina]USG62919.1 universal stress protein [Sneathiella marina]